MQYNYKYNKYKNKYITLLQSLHDNQNFRNINNNKKIYYGGMHNTDNTHTSQQSCCQCTSFAQLVDAPGITLDQLDHYPNVTLDQLDEDPIITGNRLLNTPIIQQNSPLFDTRIGTLSPPHNPFIEYTEITNNSVLIPSGSVICPASILMIGYVIPIDPEAYANELQRVRMYKNCITEWDDFEERDYSAIKKMMINYNKILNGHNKFCDDYINVVIAHTKLVDCYNKHYKSQDDPPVSYIEMSNDRLKKMRMKTDDTIHIINRYIAKIDEKTKLERNEQIEFICLLSNYIIMLEKTKICAYSIIMLYMRIIY